MQAEKLTPQGAKCEVAKCVTGATGLCNNILLSEQIHSEIAIEALERQAAEEVAKIPRTPYKHFAEVDEFMQQFDPGVCMDRRKSLVLDGPSKFGKTLFAESLACLLYTSDAADE